MKLNFLLKRKDVTQTHTHTHKKIHYLLLKIYSKIEYERWTCKLCLIWYKNDERAFSCLKENIKVDILYDIPLGRDKGRYEIF